MMDTTFTDGGGVRTRRYHESISYRCRNEENYTSKLHGVLYFSPSISEL